MTDLIQLGAILGEFFEDGAGPSHDQLDQVFGRHGLTAADPAPSGRTSSGSPLGKTKRIRRVFVGAADHSEGAGLSLARDIVALLRAEGVFTPTLSTYGGSEKIRRLKAAFAPFGLTLEESGQLHPTVIDSLAGTELTDALRAYVRRINLNPTDASLQVGTGKDLDEAVARHVLVELTGSYPVGGHEGSFPVTLANAFHAAGFAVPGPVQLDSDPHRAVQQCLFLLGKEINRLRNDAGTGHGRPGPPLKTSPLTPAQARLVARSTALLAGALLDSLQ